MYKYFKLGKKRVLEFGERHPSISVKKIKGCPLFFYILEKIYTKSQYNFFQLGKKRVFEFWDEGYPLQLIKNKGVHLIFLYLIKFI